MDSTPITTRQLESLIRLTESRARLELREVATKEDAEEVIEIMKYRLVGEQALYLQNTVMLSPLNHFLSFKLFSEPYKAGACLRFMKCYTHGSNRFPLDWTPLQCRLTSSVSQ